MNTPKRPPTETCRRLNDQILAHLRTITFSSESQNTHAHPFAEWVFATVGQGFMSPDEIAFFLGTAFFEFGELVRLQGLGFGRMIERQENPAIKAFGACVAEAVRRDLAAARGTARDVFEALTARGDNSAFAFYEAMEAIGAEPRKKV